MMNGFSLWPHPVLTKEEAAGIALYRTMLADGKVIPGILRRVYPYQLVLSRVPGEVSVPSIRYVTSGLRTLVHGLSFSGDVEYWSVSCRTASGEILFDTTPVQALMGVAATNAAGTLPDTASSNVLLQRPRGFPVIWDPPWLLDGTQALQVDGAPTVTQGAGATFYVPTDSTTARGVLNLAFHVWELPGAPGSRGPIPPTPKVPPAGPIPKLRPVVGR